MKKLILIFLLLAPAIRSFGQLGFYDSPYDLVIFSGGAHQAFTNNPAFDAWTRSAYNRKINNTPTIEADLTFILKEYDFGAHYSGTTPLGYAGVFAGRRLTAQHSKISSWLNIELGSTLARYYNISPPNYTPTPDQQGQALELHNDATYIGLSSRNYFNSLHWRIGRHNGASVNAGFYFFVGYKPFKDGHWKYGYNQEDDSDPDNTTSNFNSVTINTIPNLNNFFMDAGVFIGFGN